MTEAKSFITIERAQEVLSEANNTAQSYGVNPAGEFFFSIASEPTLAELQAMLYLALESIPKNSPPPVRAAQCTVNPDHLDADSEYGITFAGAKHLIELHTNSGFELSGLSASKGGRVWCSEIKTIPLLEAVIVSLLEWCDSEGYMPTTLEDEVAHYEAMRREKETQNGLDFFENLEYRVEAYADSGKTLAVNYQFVYSGEHARPTEQIDAFAKQLIKVWPLSEVVHAKTSQLLAGLERKDVLYVIDDDGEGPMINPRLKAISDAMIELSQSSPVVLVYRPFVGEQPRYVASTMSFLSTALFAPTAHGTLKCLRCQSMPSGCYIDFMEQDEE